MKLELSDELGAGSNPFGSKWEAGDGGFTLCLKTKQSMSRDVAQY